MKITVRPKGGTTGIEDVPIPIEKMLEKFTDGPIKLEALRPVISEISGRKNINDKGWVGAILMDMRLVKKNGQYSLTAVGRLMLDALRLTQAALAYSAG